VSDIGATLVGFSEIPIWRDGRPIEEGFVGEPLALALSTAEVWAPEKREGTSPSPTIW